MVRSDRVSLVPKVRALLLDLLDANLGHPAPLVPDSLSFHLVQNSPVTSRPRDRSHR